MNKKNEAMVGIIMPAYEQGQFLDDAIQSLKEQTYQNFKVHIVDDGSRDKTTKTKISSITYSKATIFPNSDNRGVAYRVKEHLSKMNTKYILVLCADDVLAPDFLEQTVNFLETHKKYGAVSTNVRLFEKNVADCYGSIEYDASMMKIPHILARNRVLGSSLMRKKALDDSDLSGGFVRYQDWDRWISMLEAGWSIGLIQAPLFYYRQVPTSLSHSAGVNDELEIRKKLLKKHADSYKKFYREVIIDMEQSFLELTEGKNWLEGQYRSLNNEIQRLNKELDKYRNEGILSRFKRKMKHFKRSR